MYVAQKSACARARARARAPSCAAIGGDPCNAMQCNALLVVILGQNARTAPIAAIHFTTSACICSQCHTCTNVFYTESKYKSGVVKCKESRARSSLCDLYFVNTFYDVDLAVFDLNVIQPCM